MEIDTNAPFAPVVINGRTVKNRRSVPPMTCITATEDGRATQTMTRYFERFARGGFGTIITIARGALANPDLPRRWSDRSGLNDFDLTIHLQHQES